MASVRRPSALRAALAAALPFAFPAAAFAAPPARTPLAPGFGVTPGGFVWTVEPAARRLVLRDPTGSERGAFPLAADEGHVLGVADSGARVTSSTPDGFRRRPARFGGDPDVEARYVFRFADGSVRATVSTKALRGSEPAFLGDEAWLARREAERWAVVRLAPDGEVVVGSIPASAVRQALGRTSAPRLFAAASGVAVHFTGTRGEGAVRLDRPGTLHAPDRLAACGEGRARLALPHPDGVLFVSIRTAPSTGDDEGGRPLAVAEVVDDAGRLRRSVPLGGFGEVFPLPDGGLLGLDGREAIRFDDRFVETSRAVLPIEEGADPVAAERVVAQLRRLEALGPRATGADWAELALLPGAPRSRFVEKARNDPDGALDRILRAGDGTAEALEAARVLPFLLEIAPPGERARLLDRLGEAAPAGPAWLRRTAALALLAASPSDAPGWALPAAAEAIASGSAPADLSLPDEAFTLDLAELVTAIDRARVEQVVRERPGLLDALLAGSLDVAFANESSELRFHAPPGRFARTLLDCTADPPSASGVLAVTRIAESALESAPPSPDEMAEAGAATPGDAGAARGTLAGTLLEARSSPDPGLAAAALAIGPLAGLPLDPAPFRSEVLRRPYLGAVAFFGLLADRGLSPRAWNGLFVDLFLGARAASPDPSGCSLTDGPFAWAEGESGLDGYCNLLAFVQFATLDLEGEDDVTLLSRGRIALLREFARSSSAPPELRRQLRLSRALRGAAPEEELLDLLGERDLPPAVLRAVLARAPAGSPRVAAFLEKELASGRVAPADRGAWLLALARLDGAAAERLAVEAWARGTVPLDAGEESAGAFARVLPAERVRQSEPLRAALRKTRSRPGSGPDAAVALARAGDPGSAAPLVAALLESCATCRTAEELGAIFRPLGEEGTEGLERLAAATLPFGTSALQALFEIDPARGERLAVEQLAAALDAGCVPGPLLPILFANGIDPFLPLLEALEARGCERARLRPGEPVAVGMARPEGTDSGRAAREALASAAPACRAALASLLGMEPEGP